MLINMLRAISKMIGGTPDKSRVECAKIMLDEVILGLDPKDIKVTHTIPVPNAPPVEVQPTKPPEETPIGKKEVPKNQVRVVVNSRKELERIDNYPIDGKLLMDGKVLTHQQAIGKAFKQIKMLDK